MSTQILATKLYTPPPRPEVVHRSRLIEQMNEALRRGSPLKITLISAPAGFGKTTLVSSWIYDLRANSAPESQIVNPKSKIVNQVAWLSLDEGDNELSRFLAYLVAALQTAAPHVGEKVLGLLHSSHPPPTESIMTALLNDLTTLSDRFTLVLDDYHVIEAKPVDQALAFLLEHLPPQMHLVIATREDPNLPLARLRARGHLTELRAADLRFTPTEAAEFLNQIMGLNLSAENITALETRTEGWIAGLQLAALSMQGHQDAARFIKSFAGSHRFVMDYLLEEVLHRQPEHIQTFLLHTSILDRLCGPLCDAVMGKDEGGRRKAEESGSSFILEYLERTNLFIIPLDNERRWYRYHHLFADLLRQRLPQLQPDMVAELHIRASQWYEQQQSLAEAIHHALIVGDFERTARLAELVWPAMDGRFQTATWLGWVRALPDELIRARPVLSVGVAWAFLNDGELETGEAWLQTAEQWLDTPADTTEQTQASLAGMVVVDEEQFRFLPASIAKARAYIAQALGDGPGTAKYARQALDLLPEGDHIGRGPAAALLGLALLANGDLEAAHRDLAEALANFRLAGQILFAISGVFVLADIRIAQGRLHEAIQTYQQSLQLVTDQGGILRGTADMVLGLGELYWEQGDIETATAHVLKSKELGEQAGQALYPYRWCLAQTRIKEAQGDLDSALDLLDEAERVYVRGPIPDMRPVAALKARVWSRQGRFTKALTWAREQGLSVDDDLSYLREFEHITLARLLIAQYRSDQADRPLFEAISLLERLLHAAEAGGRTGSVIEILILQALAREAQDNIPAALIPLQQALVLAEPEGYVRTFVDEGPPMARLLTEAISHGIAPDYAGRLLAAFPNLTASSTSQSKIQNPKSKMIEPLSQRELEVLQLIAEGLSNQEISERLFLALSTVKGHNRVIFGKLQVQRRTEAVARARELGLV